MIKLKDILLSEAPARVNGKWAYTGGLKSQHHLSKERHFKMDDIDEVKESSEDAIKTDDEISDDIDTKS